ncbi:MAG: NPCBM/NEW2 domain-containing protein [Candidatus Didemnitutus sp.]|nr:NPCBM/NEW2 domain-containing protein [Candidatus Didemnitutus sp.]
MNHARAFALLLVFSLVSPLHLSAAETIWLDQLDLSTVRQGTGAPQVNRSARGTPLRIAGQSFARGVGTHSNSNYRLLLAGGCERFLATIGLDDCAEGPGAVVFSLLADGKKIYDSGPLKNGDAPRTIDVDLRGVQLLLLSVLHGPGARTAFNHGDWAEARFIVTGAKPVPFVAPPHGPAEILTPKPGPEPHLNGPRVYGARPGHPFLFRIPTQGARPIEFSAEGLPPSLHLDAAAGIISGTTPDRGDYTVTLHAGNGHGRDSRILKIVAGDTLALTPSMGWNDWYAHTDRVTDAMMRAAADLMISSGLADVGYDYVNIDDCWSNAPTHRDPQRVGPARDAAGNILPNRRFPDMKALTDYIHARGLKAGIYSSPGELTCAKFASSWGHEAQDAAQFAAWGFDFLKYDWCSYRLKVGSPPSLDEMQRPYRLMGPLLRQQNRDILFNLCQYGIGDVWKWGADVDGHSWRTGGDLGYELDRLFSVALKNASLRDYQKPGSWNDPDYLQIGFMGPNKPGEKGKPFALNPTEQYAFMSLWSLMAAPLFYSGDLTALDEFTLNVLCNREVIAIDQDPLGECARVVKVDEECFLMVKLLEDGSHAVGLCNGSEIPQRLAARWTELGFAGAQLVRDVWRQKDLGPFATEFAAEVPRHGVVLIRVQAQK